jgi:PilZ domain-containing protein
VTVRCELVSRTSLRVDAPVGTFARATVANGVVGADGVRLAVAFAVRPGAGDGSPGYDELSLTHAVVLGERRAERFVAAGDVAVRVNSADDAAPGEPVHLVDVSRTGVAFDATRPFDVGQRLVVRARAVGGLEVPVEVVRMAEQDADTRYGCRLLAAEAADDLLRLAGPVAQVP